VAFDARAERRDALVRGRTGMVLGLVGLGSGVGAFVVVGRKRPNVVLGLGVHMRGARLGACADGHDACAVGLRLRVSRGKGCRSWALRGGGCEA